MAGVTDRPFRILCRKLGAGLAASEMLTSDVRLWSTSKSRHRMNHEGEPEPRVVQLAGADCAGARRSRRARTSISVRRSSI
jgi:tRNA-dihydrouridine synthase B